MEITNARICPEVTEEQYHAETGIGDGLYLTRSMICTWIQSPRLFWLRYLDKNPLVQKKANDGMRFGTLVESMLSGKTDGFAVQPETYTDDKGAEKPWHFGARACRAWRAEQHQSGRVVVSQSDLERALFVADEMRDVPMIAAMLHKGKSWQVVVRAEVNGLPVQCMLDLVGDTFLCDVKTTKDPLGKFMSSVDTYGYDVQEALYSRMHLAATGKSLPWYFAVGSTCETYEADALQLPDFVVDHARSKCDKALDEMAEHNFDKPRLDERATMVYVPMWWTSKYDEEGSR